MGGVASSFQGFIDSLSFARGRGLRKTRADINTQVGQFQGAKASIRA